MSNLKKMIHFGWLGSNNTIGTIYSESSWIDLTDFTNQGSSVVINSNELSFSGGANTYTQSLGITRITNLAKWNQRILATVGNKDATSWGFGLGIRSTAAAEKYDSLVRFNMDTGVNSGKIAIVNTLVGGTKDVVTSSGALSFSVNDQIELIINFIQDTMSVSARNITTGSSSITLDFDYDDDPLVPTLGRYSVFSFGGAFSINQWHVSSDEYLSPSILYIGDSKTSGYYASSFSLGFARILQNTYARSSVYGGPGHRTSDVVTLLTEITDVIRPTKVFLEIGSNDLRSGISSATWQANYASIVSTLESAGIEIVHSTGIYETSLNQSSFRTYILIILL